jgi:tetratricopeptide (TPR) repeat protein
MGVTPQPGLAQALVVRGRPEAAATSLRRVLGSKGMGPLDRAKLLPTQLEIAVQLGDLPTARAAVTELAAIASNHRTTALRAGADAGAATVLHAEGDFPAAEVAARRAYELYTEIDLTYEAARVEELLARIHQGLGDTDQALARNAAALATFERIGAVLDARRVREALAPA